MLQSMRPHKGHMLRGCWEQLVALQGPLLVDMQPAYAWMNRSDEDDNEEEKLQYGTQQDNDDDCITVARQDHVGR